MTTDVRIIREQIRAATAERDKLAASRRQAQASLEEQLARTATFGPFQFNASEARRLRSEIAATDALLADLEARLETLNRLLPSAEAIARGRESCLQLGADLADAQQRFVAATAAYLASLDAAEAASRLLQQAREASRTAQDALARSVAQFGLEADVPVPPILDVGRVAPPVQKVVGLKTRFIFDAVGGPEDGQVVKELAAAVAEAQLDRLLPV